MSKKRNFYDCKDRNVGDYAFAWIFGFVEV